MRVTFDPAKRDKALAERGLDFADAAIVVQGVTLDRIYSAWHGSPCLQHEESQ